MDLKDFAQAVLQAEMEKDAGKVSTFLRQGKRVAQGFLRGAKKKVGEGKRAVRGVLTAAKKKVGQKGVRTRAAYAGGGALAGAGAGAGLTAALMRKKDKE